MKSTSPRPSTGETVTAAFPSLHFFSKNPRPQIPGESNEFGQGLGFHCPHCHLSWTSPEKTYSDRQAHTHTHIYTPCTFPLRARLGPHTCVITQCVSTSSARAASMEPSSPPADGGARLLQAEHGGRKGAEGAGRGGPRGC